MMPSSVGVSETSGEGKARRTDKRVCVLLEPQVGDVVGDLLGAPVDQQAGGADAAVSAVGEGGRGVLGAQRPGAGGRALVLDGDLVALPAGALELVVGVRVLVVLGQVVVGHGAAGGRGRRRRGSGGGRRARAGRRAGGQTGGQDTGRSRPGSPWAWARGRAALRRAGRSETKRAGPACFARGEARRGGESGGERAERRVRGSGGGRGRGGRGRGRVPCCCCGRGRRGRSAAVQWARQRACGGRAAGVRRGLGECSDGRQRQQRQRQAGCSTAAGAVQTAQAGRPWVRVRS